MDLNWKQFVPTEADFEFWIKHKLNVLFIGGHGIGKTTLITQAFKKYELRHRYFSASTMDPWVDFIGVPKEVSDETGEYLDLVKPKDFRDDNIQALFFDEYNRAPKKVQNAVMELIQFKSINGRRFNNLDMVWAAINDNTEKGNEYNVDKLDPAQLDRFHVIVQLPNKPQISYFRKNHGELGEVACKWWDDLSPELKAFISPRRLDYVLDIYSKGGNISYCLPANANVNTLLTNLKQGLPYNALLSLIAEGEKNKLKNWLNKAINFDQVEKEIIKDHLGDCLPLLNQEKQTELLSKYDSIKKHINEKPEEFSELIINVRRSRDSRLRAWALQVKLTVDTSDLSGFSSWDPGARRATLERQAKGYSSHDWNLFSIAGDVSKSSISFVDTDNAEIETLISSVAPNSDHKTTYDKMTKLNKIYKALSQRGISLSLNQVEKLIWAINYWSFGFQDMSIEKIFSANKSAKKITTDLLAKYIYEKKAHSEKPSVLFDKLQYIYVLYNHLELKWI
jgi:hypothetical protein